MGGKVLDRKSSAEFKVAVGHPVRKLCPGESSRPKIEICETRTCKEKLKPRTLWNEKTSRLTVEPEETSAFMDGKKFA